MFEKPNEKNYNKYNIILSIMRRQVYKKVIEIAPDLKRQIAMEMGCTVDTVYNALNLSNPTTGAQPDRIRRRAMELGGKENRKIRWINYRRPNLSCERKQPEKRGRITNRTEVFHHIVLPHNALRE